MDDLISSANLPCTHIDDEEECQPEVGSGDELITPVYVPSIKTSTIHPVVTNNKFDGIVKGRPSDCSDDDEDCGVVEGKPGIFEGNLT